MRPALLALVFATAAAAQPTADRAAAREVRPTSPVPSGVSGGEGRIAALEVQVGRVTAGVAGAVAGALPVTLFFEAANASSGIDFPAQAFGITAGALGATLVVVGLRRHKGGRGNPFLRALGGAALGTLPGLFAARLGGTDASLTWLAVPVAQGIGAGLAVGWTDQ